MYRTRRPLLALLAAGVIATMSVLPAATASAAFAISPRVDVSAGWRAHIQNVGDRWASKNIELVYGTNVFDFTLGTQGQSLRLEYVSLSPVVISSNIKSVIGSRSCSINVQGHVQNIGWQGVSSSAGTRGQGLRLEAIKMWSTCSDVKIRYSAHVQNIGWMDMKTAGQMAGTSGRGLAIEAIRVRMELPDLSWVPDRLADIDCQMAGTC
ncbi:hypothetical protein ASF87_03070 [Microbacterium sp. Leaf161]|uniref:Ig domain-containing protein n=1 Tax=Microbacterium sp. Leaf161 TaxID=1736281 RepID=UPI0006F658DE|nr:Ig domain-containing protein [Microbacterium sp. Leaf161]KQR47942.1 hypothetical protein ASF87_03070 [Microbacterium sp. Leaf161]